MLGLSLQDNIKQHIGLSQDVHWYFPWRYWCFASSGSTPFREPFHFLRNVSIACALDVSCGSELILASDHPLAHSTLSSSCMKSHLYQSCQGVGSHFLIFRLVINQWTIPLFVLRALVFVSATNARRDFLRFQIQRIRTHILIMRPYHCTMQGFDTFEIVSIANGSMLYGCWPDTTSFQSARSSSLWSSIHVCHNFIIRSMLKSVVVLPAETMTNAHLLIVCSSAPLPFCSSFLFNSSSL